MISEVGIVNIALARLGESPIQSFEEGSVPANMAKVFYDPARRAVLRAYDWGFSLKTVRLARYTGEPVDFRFAFSLPADCLRAIRLRRKGVADFTDGCDIRFVIRSGALYTDEAEAYLEYVSDVEDTALFDDKFIEVLGYKLASDLAMPVKKVSDKVKEKMSKSHIGKRLTPIVQLTMQGEYIATFNSVKEAGEKLGISPCNISTVINHKAIHAGHYKFLKLTEYD